MIRILITDDHPVIRKGIRQMLEDEPEIGLIHEAADGKEFIEKIRNQLYDILLLDISLPGRSGMDLIRQAKKIQRSAAILIFSIHSEDIFALTALKSGASGYITKSTPPEEVVSAIKRVARGEKYISPYLSQKLAEFALNENGRGSMPKLSVRETEVLNQFAAGKSLKEIAEHLSLSPKTIGTYRERLLSKLNLKSTSELIRFSVLQWGKEQAENDLKES